MVDDTLQEVRERLIKIEILLENISKNNELKNEILEEKIKVANSRISDLENSNTWLWREIAGSLISAVIALLI